MQADGSGERSLVPSLAGDSWPAWRPSGELSFMSDRDGENALFTVDVDGSNVQLLPVDPTLISSRHDWSPDGERLVFTSQKDGLNQIYAVDADGTNEQRLTAIAEGISAPAWSPDGTRIAFVTWIHGPPSIYIMNADGSDLRRLTGEPGVEDFDPSWSPDGTQLVFSRFSESGAGQLIIVNADGSGSRPLTTGGRGASQPSWSPDGSRIAFVRAGDIWSIGADGSGLRQLTDDPRFDESPGWSPDGSMIAFVSDRDGGQAILCNYMTISDYAAIPTLDQLAWTSHAIVAGTLVEELPAAFGELLDPEFDQSPPIYTDFIIEVEAWVRGHAVETVRIRQPGGTVGACTQYEENAPALEVGERVLLFLLPDDLNPSLPEAWIIQGGYQGYWPLDGDGRVQSSGYPDHTGQSLDALADIILEILAQPDAAYPDLVPLEDAPAAR
jgi:dipeptidyl aminopeptidase/acylaminoacyl peptidase